MPVTLEIPKPLVPVQGRPILSWQVQLFAQHGVTDVLVIVPQSVRPLFDKWQREASEQFPSVRLELWSEPEAMGTMGALVHEFSNRFRGISIFVTNGDELKGFDLTALADFHTAGQHAATIALTRVPNPSDYGVAEMEGSRIVKFHEKPKDPPSNLINSGLYVIEPAAFEDVDHSQKYLMFEKDFFPMLASSGRLGGCAVDGQWYDCGTLERWERAIREWKGG